MKTWKLSDKDVVVSETSCSSGGRLNSADTENPPSFLLALANEPLQQPLGYFQNKTPSVRLVCLSGGGCR